jgi:hypothetical protein
VKTRAKRPTRKPPSKLQGAVEVARERWLAAKKSAKRAKQAAKQARRQFKDAKKIVKRAKEEMMAAANKVKSSVSAAVGKKARVKTATKAPPPKPAIKAAPPKPAKARATAKRPARKKPAPAEVASTVAIEQASPAQLETPTT